MNTPRQSCWLSLLVGLSVGPSVVVVLALCGCGTGQYNEAFNNHLAELAKGAGPTSLFDTATDVKSGEVVTAKIRLPTLFAKPDLLVAPAEGAQPPFVALPGLAYTFSQAVDAAGTPATVYVYFATVEAASTPVDQLKSTLQTEIGKASLNGAWEEISLTAPEGGAAVTASRLRVVGSQMFSGAQAEGQFDLYVVSTPTHHVLIGWRAPKTAVDALSFPAASEASMATFTPAGSPAGSPPG